MRMGLAASGVVGMAAARAPMDTVPASYADRLAGALWGVHIADALAMPTHWYYGGHRQVEADYGNITGYVKPKVELRGSIMALSNTGGAGRGRNDGTIIGTVIAHGKKQYWTRERDYHYHCTLDKGENTVDADLVRVNYRTIADDAGQFIAEHLRDNYVSFMTTPGNYNDCYMSTTHRMFFANKERGLPLEKCPDNDNHNVDAIDGLTMLIPVALATAHLPSEEAHKQVRACISVTRRSDACEQYGVVVADMLRLLLAEKPLGTVLQKVGGKQLESMAAGPDPVVACYLDSNFPATLSMTYKHGADFEAALLANANVGGENVNRGMVMGALLGAAHGASRIPSHLKDGLKDSAGIARDIEAFVASVRAPSMANRNEM